MKVCFKHEQFDSDVSSGTDHVMYQWITLLGAFSMYLKLILLIQVVSLFQLVSQVTDTQGTYVPSPNPRERQACNLI